MKITEIVKQSKKKLTKNGDCFVIAGRNIIDAKIPNLFLVHALVYGQGPLKGRRFPHAWNEIDEAVVIDQSNNNNAVLRRDAYYSIGKINPNEKGAYVRYTSEQALIKFVQTKHWGPWDLNSALEEDQVNEMLEIPIGRKGKATTKVPSVLYHSLRGRKLGPSGEIQGYPINFKEKELEQMWTEPGLNGYVWLSMHPLDPTSLAIDIYKLNPNNLRFTGQSEGYLLHKGPIPHDAILRGAE